MLAANKHSGFLGPSASYKEKKVLQRWLQGQNFARYKTKTRANLNFWELSVEDERAVVDAPRRAAHLELVGVDRRQVVHDVLEQKKWKILINLAARFLGWHQLYKFTTKKLSQFVIPVKSVYKVNQRPYFLVMCEPSMNELWAT